MMGLYNPEIIRFPAVENAKDPWPDNQRPVFDPRGGRLVSASEYSRYIHVFSENGQHISDVACVACHVVYSPSGSRLLASAGASVMVFDTEDFTVLHTLSGFPGPLCDEEVSPEMAVSPDEKLIVCGGCRGFTSVWDAAGGRLLYSLSLSDFEVTRIVFTGPGNRVVISTRDELLVLLDAGTGEILRKSDAGGTVLCASPDGKTLYLTPFGDFREVVVWDVASWKRCGEFRLPNGRGCEGMRVSPDGSLMAAGGSDGVMLLSLPDRELLWESPELSTVYYEDKSLAFSPDGKFLCAGKGAYLYRISL